MKIQKKVGILTVHHAYNFGAMLQSYATYRMIKDMGFHAEIIDYDNDTFANERYIFLPFNSVGNIVRNLRSIFQYGQLKQRVEKYEKFYRLIKVSNRKYSNNNIGEVEGYDIVLTGSDQTFCLYLTDNPDDIRPFFLKEIHGVRKVSYASSMGEKFYKLTNEDNTWIGECLNEYSYLSVREEKSVDYISKLIGVQPELVLDPTLLLEENQWTQVMADTKYNNCEYIAFYTVLSEPWVIKYVNALSKKTGLKVVALHPRTRYEINSKFDYVGALGPSEFLSMIKNATYVVTTSFHATAFSIIFKKQFVSLKIGEGNRLRSLLNMLNLDNQLISETSCSDFSILTDRINWEVPYEMLSKEKEKSRSYLLNALK